MLGLGEVGVAAEQDAAKASPKTSDDGAIEGIGGAFMTGAVAGTINDAHDLAGVCQTDDESMITPGAFVADVHAFFALAVGAHQGAVGVEASLLAEILGLLLPEFHPSVIEDVLQTIDLFGAETSAIIAGGSGIGSALGAESVEKRGVVAAQLHVLETSAVTQGVDGEVEDMIGIVIREVYLQDVQTSIDGVNQADVLGEFVESGDAAEGRAIDAVVEFEVKVSTATKDGLGEVGKFAFVEASLDESFAGAEFLAKKAMALVGSACGQRFGVGGGVVACESRASGVVCFSLEILFLKEGGDG